MSLLDNLLKDGTQIAVRKAMVAGGGFLISKGLADAATAHKIEDGLGSLILIGLAWGWSRFHLKNAKAQAVIDTIKAAAASAVDVQKALGAPGIAPDPSKSAGLMQGQGGITTPPPTPPTTP